MELFEILDVLVGLAQVCGCFLEVLGLSSGVGTGVAAVKVRKNRAARRLARQIGQPPPPRTTWRWLLWVLVPLTAFFVGLILLKYFR